MIDVPYELEQLDENPEWLTVLETYDRLIDASKKANPDSDGWIARLREFEDVEQEDLSYIHGSLIAHGFLRFQIADRTSGMEYQLSQLGKKALMRGFVESDGELEDRNDEDNIDIVDTSPDTVVASECSTSPVAGSVEEADSVIGEIDPTEETATNASEAAAVEVSAELQSTEDTPVELVQLTIESTVADESTASEIEVAETDSAAASPTAVGPALPIIALDELKKSA
jgi:hypothetical protein